MSGVLKCAICGQVIDQDESLIQLQNRLFGDIKQDVFCKDCNDYFFKYIRPLMKWWADQDDRN